MRKIISILVALGLVLAFSATVVPTAGAACTADVTLTNDCAAHTDVTYTINFTSPVTLLPGNDLISVDFAAGTGLNVTGDAWTTGDITVNGYNVTIAKVALTGTHVEFPVPAGAMINAGESVIVVIRDVTNPDGGKKTLSLDYQLVCCDPVVFDCAEYTIKPAKSTYKFILDAGMSPADADAAIVGVPVLPLPEVAENATWYPGIAKDFYPPTQFCEWNFWVLNFTVDTEGCAGYDDVQVEITMDDAPAGCNTTFYVFGWNGTPLTQGWMGPIVLQKGDSVILPEPGMNISANMSMESALGFNLFPVVSHSDCKGTYTWSIEAYVNVPAGTCQAEGSKLQLDKVTFTDKQYQWLDAEKVILDEKWNLISLPLVPPEDPPIEDYLASINPTDRAQIVSIWYYDNCEDVPEEDKWHNWPAGDLEILDHGMAYWLKVMPYPQTDCGNITWWVWGTEKPMPPASPAQYDVCEGWNMVGFLGTAANVSAYLWNWGAPTPVVYGWDHGCFANQKWVLKTASDALVLGQGYWMAFPHDGAVYVP